MILVTNELIDQIIESKKDIFLQDEIINLIKQFSERKNRPIVESNNIIANPNNYTVTNNGNQFFLPKKEFLLLHFLILNKNKALTRNYILNNVWGTEIIVGIRTIDVHIRKIKKKLHLNDITLVGVKGVGYMWVEK